jgi:hypothetical protein
VLSPFADANSYSPIVTGAANCPALRFPIKCERRHAFVLRQSPFAGG